MTPTAHLASHALALADGHVHGDGAGLGLLILAGLAAAGLYLAACWIWPFRRCRWCKGTGRSRSPTGRAWRECRHCRGTGAKVRAGRKAWTRGKRLHRAGTRPVRHRGDPWQ